MSQQQPLSWNSSEAVERWKQEATVRQQLMAEATERMLRAAQIEPGYHVLDLAAGVGDQSILAARLVGPTGSVLATDLSSEMLKAAASSVQQEGLSNITTRVMDAQQLDLKDASFDAALCRNGLMLMPHPQQASKEVWRVLKPGKRLAALVWSRPERNPLFSLPMSIIGKYSASSSSEAPNVFSLSDPSTFEHTLKVAGFREVTLETIPLHFHYDSLEAYLQARRGMLANAMQQLSQQEQQHLLEEVKQALQQFEGPHGFEAPGETLLGVGTR